MSFENVLNNVYKDNFEDAVSSWRDYSLEKYASVDNAIQKWNTCARTLEARLVYLLLLQPDEKLSEALENYRFWLLKQKTTIVDWSEIGELPLELPKNFFVGQKDIDADHQELFSIANDIRNNLRAGEYEGAADKASIMLDKSLAHFKREVEILKRYNYT